MAKLSWTQSLARVHISALAHPGPHSAVLGLISRVLATTKGPHALLVLVGVGGLPGGRVWVSGCVGHVSIALWLSNLGSSQSHVAQVVRGLLSRGVCHALRRVVLAHARGVAGCCLALQAPVVARRHLVSRHLVGAGPWLRGGLLVRCSALLRRAPDSACACSSRCITRVAVVGARVGWVAAVVVGGHAVHVDTRGPLTGPVLAHHSSRGSTGLLVTSVRTVVVHLSQLRLPCARPSTVHQPLVVTVVPLMLVG